jgi:hypothetical protein
MPSCNAKETSVICDHCAAEFRNVTLEVNQIFGLLSCMNIIKVNVFVSPLEVVDNAFICQLLLQNKNVLEEVKDTLLYIEVIEFSNHSLLVLQISLILVD